MDYVFAILLMLAPDGRILVGDSQATPTVAACVQLINETEQDLKAELPKGAHWQGFCINMKAKTPAPQSSSDIQT